jgi:cyclase
MLSTRVIPCLDVHNGRTVKGINFLNLQDAGDPVEQAKLYSEVGADEICFLDISATNEQRKAMFDVISETAETSLVPLTVGGGVNSLDDFRKLLNSGADKVSINSSAVYNSTLINEASFKFGNQCVVLAIDAMKNFKMPSGYEVTTHGGRKKNTDRCFKMGRSRCKEWSWRNFVNLYDYRRHEIWLQFRTYQVNNG